MARIDGKAVFVPFSLPNETLEIEITDNRKDYSFAKIVSVIESSPHRVQPVCPLFGMCGGCSLQMSDDVYQTELRLSILKDVLYRAHVQPVQEISVECGQPMEYRSRFQFHRTQDGNIGFKAESSNTIVPVTDCPVAVPKIRQSLTDGSLKRSARHLNTGDRFHVFAHDGQQWQEDVDTRCSLNISGQTVLFDVRGFFQSNVPMLERLIAMVGDASGERLLDFYSGVGTFSIFAGRAFRDVVLVEHNREALLLARDNLAGRDIPPTICNVSDEKWPSHPASRLAYDTAIIDPPRQGLNKQALAWFADSGIPDIRYVSCDPVTFARDTAKLVASGYTLEKAVMFDFYPQTHHIETLGFFKK